MGNLDNRKENFEKLKEKLRELVSFKIKNLIPESEKVPLEVEGFAEALEEIQGKSSEMLNENLEVASLPKIRNVLKSAVSIISSLNDISNFNIPSDLNQIESQWKDLISQFIIRSENFYHHAGEVLLTLPRDDYQAKEINKKIKKDAEEISKVRDQIAQYKVEAEKSLTAQRSATGETSVSIHSSIFEDEAKKHSAAANWWGGGALLIGLGIISSTFFSVNFVPFDLLIKANFGYILQIIVAKAIFFSTLIGILTVFVRNHRAHRHNAVVNEHRHNALRTFSAFMESAKDDDQTKNAILLLTTESIFSASPTGYIPKESEKIKSAHLMDLVNIVAKKTPSP